MLLPGTKIKPAGQRQILVWPGIKDEFVDSGAVFKEVTKDAVWGKKDNNLFFVTKVEKKKMSRSIKTAVKSNATIFALVNFDLSKSI